jgi:hypothetical protein
MHRYQKRKNNVIKNIIKYINSDIKLKASFNHPNRKYKLNILLKHIIDILNTGLSFRKIQEIKNNKIHWNTIYKFFIKLQKTDIISLTYHDTVKKYTKKYLNKSSNIFITDTTLIINKLGIDNIGYNPQIPKHKCSKISIISDINGIPLDANIYNGSTYDSKILDIQLDEFIKNNTNLLTNNNLILGDAGYDSNKLKNKVINNNIGILLTARNKRNIKNKNKLDALKLTSSEKLLLEKRIKIEHTNAHLKQYKRLSIRYDKYSNNYRVFLYLACIDIILKRTS